jgi:hypothetical protein
VNKNHYIYILVWIIRYYGNGANNFPCFEGIPQFFSPSYREIKKTNVSSAICSQLILNTVMNFEKFISGYRLLIVTFLKL